MNSLSYSMIYSACFALLVNYAAPQTLHIVGDSFGWRIPPTTSFYSNWTSGKTFLVGDILEFNFMTRVHNVVRVPKASYDNCSGDGVIGNVLAAGPVNVTLDSTGDRYYICSEGTHCQSGQKLLITVSPTTPGGPVPPPPPMTAAAPPPTTPTMPLPASPKAGLPPPPHSPPPPPTMSSSSVSLGGSFFIITMCATLALNLIV